MDAEDSTQGQVIEMERQKSLQDLLGLSGKPETHAEAVRSQQARPQPPAAATPVEAELDRMSPVKTSDPLPSPGDPYRAHALLNRLAEAQRHLHFVDRQCFSTGFAYHDLRRVSWADPGKPGVGPVLLLRFIEATVTDVRIEGRNLGDIRHWIGEGLMPWVRELPGGFAIRDPAAPVITAIILSELEG